MNDEEHWCLKQIQIIREQLAGLQRSSTQLSMLATSPLDQVTAQLNAASEAIATTLDQLQVLQEEMQTNSEAMLALEESLIEQNEQLIAQRQHYYNLFVEAPDGYLLTDAQGLILEANRVAATLLNVQQPFLVGKPLAVYIPQPERQAFRLQLAELHQPESLQQWEVRLQPRDGAVFTAALTAAPVRNQDGLLVGLRICIRQMVAASITPGLTHPAAATPALDGLQVLFVDDEADTRELVVALLQQHRISVTAVATVAEALQALE